MRRFEEGRSFLGVKWLIQIIDTCLNVVTVISLRVHDAILFYSSY